MARRAAPKNSSAANRPTSSPATPAEPTPVPASSPPPAVARPAAEVESARPTPDAIRARAYRLFIERGGSPGQELADWLRAEHELIEELRRAR